MKKILGFVLITLMPLFLSLRAHADNREGQLTFTLGDGLYRFDPKRRIDNTGVPYGALSYNLSDRYAVEALLGFFNTPSHNPVDNNSQVNGTLFALDVIYRFKPCGVVEPYILAGPGATSMNPNGTDAHTEGNVNVGVGTQLFIDKMIAFRIEIQDFYTIVSAKNDLLFNGGVSFLFDI